MATSFIGFKYCQLNFTFIRSIGYEATSSALLYQLPFSFCEMNFNIEAGIRSSLDNLPQFFTILGISLVNASCGFLTQCLLWSQMSKKVMNSTVLLRTSDAF